MGFVLVNAESVAPQPWRNGGGQTRELLAWPLGPDWRLRISRADIAADGPFSAFPGVQRWFTVLQGAGVLLTFGDEERRVQPGDAPLYFDGAAAPGCYLLNGPTQDLNLMARKGSGVMRAVQPGHEWSEACAMRGIYTTGAGVWCGAQQTLQLCAHTLLWMQPGGKDPWTFDAADGAKANAWWLGFTPEE